MYLYEVPGTAVVFEYVSTAPTVAIFVATAAPSARHTSYPVAPVDAAHVTVTFAVLVPSVAATLSGAVRFRYPELTVLANPGPAAESALTE